MRQFYGRLERCVLSAGKTHVHKIPRFRGGGGIWGFGGGGGSADFIFMGARIFLPEKSLDPKSAPEVGKESEHTHTHTYTHTHTLTFALLTGRLIFNHYWY